MTETEHALGAAALVPVGRADAPSSRYDANEPQQQIEADIARTQDRVGSTLDALERKLSPRRLIAEGTDSLLDAVGRDPDKIWTQLRANAIPLGLIAAGLAWLVFARQEPRSGTRDDASDNRTKTAGTPLPLAAPSPIVHDDGTAPPDATIGLGIPAATEMPGERSHLDPAAVAGKPAAVMPDETRLMPEHSREGD